MVAHATPEDLTDWLPESTPTVEDAERLLLRASELVDSVVRAAYSVGPTGAPTDVTVTVALRDATCAVVEAWLEVGEENDVDGLAGSQIAVTGYSGPRAPSVPPRAARILTTAGLTQVAAAPAGSVWP